MPSLGYEFAVKSDKISPIKKSIKTPDDKNLYLSILNTLNLDYRKAKLDVASGNPSMQRLAYVIKTNAYLGLTTDEEIVINKDVEAFTPEERQKMYEVNPLLGPIFEKNTDLQ